MKRELERHTGHLDSHSGIRVIVLGGVCSTALVWIFEAKVLSVAATLKSTAPPH
jgi:hypothetical protein